MALSQSTVLKLYLSVIDDVINGVRECFLDEGVDEQVLQELKQTWESKVQSNKAVDNSDSGDAITNRSGVKMAQMNKKQEPAEGGSALYADEGRQEKMYPVQITLPAQQNSGDTTPRVLTIQVPESAITGNQLQSVLTGPLIGATLALPTALATSLLQQHVTAALQAGVVTSRPFPQKMEKSGQLDGGMDSSDDDDDDDDGDEEDDLDGDDLEGENDEADGDEGPEEEPLNSEDDVSEEDVTDMLDTENVVVCQYDKITRSRNKWKFYLKDGVMNLQGKDYVFQKSNGDAEW